MEGCSSAGYLVAALFRILFIGQVVRANLRRGVLPARARASECSQRRFRVERFWVAVPGGVRRVSLHHDVGEMNLARDGERSVLINNLEIAQTVDIGLAIDYKFAQSLPLFGDRRAPQ